MERKDLTEMLYKAIQQEFKTEKEYDREDGVDVESPEYRPDSLILKAIEAFESYRKVRIEQAYFAKMSNNLSQQQKALRFAEYDENRRYAHNNALGCVNMLNRVVQMLGFPPVYTGRSMTDEEIENHTNLDARKECTDFFLNLIAQLEDMSITKLEQLEGDKSQEDKDKSQEAKQFAKENLSGASRAIRRTTIDYGLKYAFKEDDGDIVFEDDDGR